MSRKKTNTPKKAPSPLAYMCPSCRGVFRIDTNKQGIVSCPLCEEQVTINPSSAPSVEQSIASNQAHKKTPSQSKKIARAEPKKTEPKKAEPTESKPTESKPTVKSQPSTQTIKTTQAEEPKETTDDKAEENKSVRQRKIVKKRALRPGEAPPNPFFIELPTQKIITWGTCFALSALLAVGGYLIFQKNKYRIKSNPAQPVVSQFEKNSSSSPLSDTAGNQKETLDFTAITERAQTFLKVENIENFSSLIRNPDVVMPRLREFYQKNPFPPSEIFTLTEESPRTSTGSFTHYTVSSSLHESKKLTLETTNGKDALVDWESWVGYCEKPWADFVSTKCPEPTLMRVILSKVHYYNYQFSDEEKWACFRLFIPTDDTRLYGYLPKDSPLINKLPSQERVEAQFIVTIKYPLEADSQNQVLIEDIISESWLNENTE